MPLPLTFPLPFLLTLTLLLSFVCVGFRNPENGTSMIIFLFIFIVDSGEVGSGGSGEKIECFF